LDRCRIGEMVRQIQRDGVLKRWRDGGIEKWRERVTEGLNRLIERRYKNDIVMREKIRNVRKSENEMSKTHSVSCKQIQRKS
jgi:hypothetical protein